MNATGKSGFNQIENGPWICMREKAIELCWLRIPLTAGLSAYNEDDHGVGAGD